MVLYVEISTKIEQSKSLIMRFVGIVASALVSGGYYNVGGASDINILKSTKTEINIHGDRLKLMKLSLTLCRYS